MTAVTAGNGVPTAEIRVPADLMRRIRMTLAFWDAGVVPAPEHMALAIDQLSLRDELNDVLLQRERDVQPTEPEKLDLLTMKSLVWLCDARQSSINEWRKAGIFPEPRTTIGTLELWDRAAVMEFMDSRGKA